MTVLYRKTLTPAPESSDGETPVVLICEKATSAAGIGNLVVTYLYGPLGSKLLAFEITGHQLPSDAIEAAVWFSKEPLLSMWPEESGG